MKLSVSAYRAHASAHKKILTSSYQQHYGSTAAPPACCPLQPPNFTPQVWADKKHLAKKAAGAARRSACATGGGPSNAPTLSSVEMRILSIMGDGFGEPQTEARVSAFPLCSNILTPPVGLLPDPAATTSARTVADNPPTPSIGLPPSQEQPSTSQIEPLELEIQNTMTRRSINTRRVRRVNRHLPADSARSRIIQLEEQRLQAEMERNEQLRMINETNREIKTAIVDLCKLVREYITRVN